MQGDANFGHALVAGADHHPPLNFGHREPDPCLFL
jgi:hypothetical protein